MTVEYDARYTAYQTERSWLRRQVRRIYLSSAIRQLRGPVLDFGCGVGELLERLPVGSHGLEYNQATVEYCRGRGLAVDAYDGFADDWSLSVLSAQQAFESMVISHVLEHLQDPVWALNRLLIAARGVGVERVLVIVPGPAGFRIDPTHLTFVDAEMLARPDVLEGTAFAMKSAHYFPGNARRLGTWFPHHELQVMYRLKDWS